MRGTADTAGSSLGRRPVRIAQWGLRTSVLTRHRRGGNRPAVKICAYPCPNCRRTKRRKRRKSEELSMNAGARGCNFNGRYKSCCLRWGGGANFWVKRVESERNQEALHTQPLRTRAAVVRRKICTRASLTRTELSWSR